MTIKHTLALLALVPLTGCIAIVDIEDNVHAPSRHESTPQLLAERYGSGVKDALSW